MIENLSESHGNILGLRASGKLTDGDYKEILVPRIEAVAQEYGKVRFLFYLDESFKGWEPRAMWDDFEFAFSKFTGSFEKMALVGGPIWVEWGMKLGKYLIPAEVKTFPGDQLQEAWDWICC